MPEMPFAITGSNLEEIKQQATELFRILFEDRIGGYDKGELSVNKFLALNGSKDVVTTQVSGYAEGVLGTSPISITDNGNGTVTVIWTPVMTSWVAGTTNEIEVADDGDGTVTLSLATDLQMTDLEGLIYYAGKQ
jgi:hypothetical protein